MFEENLDYLFRISVSRCIGDINSEHPGVGSGLPSSLLHCRSVAAVHESIRIRSGGDLWEVLF